MHILCPHCRNPIEVVKFVAREEIACPSCGSSFHLESESTTGWQPGSDKLGKFELIETVGQGAFGTVYKARDPELDRTVAVKVPRAGNLTGPQELDRFLREARSVAQLHHPSIVSVHEVGQQDGVPYLVSDFVQGVTLADRLTARRPTFRETAELLAAVADALQYAHERGVIHRDVKPSNIMIGDDGRPCVMDFGLAKRDAGEITMTIEGQVLGTPAYMSPEQARGDAHKADGRGDVYSLGVIFYELLTGELPFRGNKRMLLNQVLHDEPRTPRSLNDHISSDLETICLKAMAKEPARRYATAQELAEDLRRWLNGEPIRARPVGRWERALRWARRRPAVASLVAVSGLATLALVGLIVGAAYHARLTTAYEAEEEQRLRAEDALGVAEEQRKKAEGALGVAEVARQAEAAQRLKVEQALGIATRAQQGEATERKRAEDALTLADEVAYRHSVLLANLALNDNKVALARQRLEECKPALRGWEWRYLNGQCHKELFSVPGEKAVLSPDGSRLAVDGKDQSVRVYDTRTSKELFQLKALAGLGDPVFSPDGSRIVVGDPLPTLPNPMEGSAGDGVLRVYDAWTGKEVFQLKAPPGLGFPAFSPDSSRIVAGAGRSGGDGVVRVYDAQTGKELLQLKAPGGLEPPTFSPDGTRIAVNGRDEVLRMYDAQTGKEALQLKAPGGLGYPVFSSDGSRIVAAGSDNSLRVYDARTGIETIQVKLPTKESVFRLSPDGTRIAVAGQLGFGDGTVRVFDVRTGKEALQLKAPVRLDTPNFSPDGSRIAVESSPFRLGDGVVRVYDARTGKEVLQLTAPASLGQPEFSRDGSRLVVWPSLFNGDGLVRVYDARMGKESLVLKDFAGGAFPWFSPDGTRIAASGPQSGKDKVVRVCDARTGKESLQLKLPRIMGGFSFSPDGTRIAGAGDAPVQVYDARTGKEALQLEVPGGVEATPAFSPDGSRIVASCRDGVTRVYDARTGKEALQLKAPGELGVATFSPDGSRIAAGSSTMGDGVVRVYDARTGKEVLQLKASGELYLAAPRFSPDGSRIAAGAFSRDPREPPATVRVYDAHTGKETLRLEAPTGLFFFCFSPDGTRIAAGSSPVGDLMVRVYDARTGKETLQLQVPGGLGTPEFSRDGSRIAVGPPFLGGDKLKPVRGGDGMLRVYDAPGDISAWQAGRREALLEGLSEWHRVRAEESEETRDWFAAVFHLGRLLQNEPQASNLYIGRGGALAEMGKVHEAKQDFTAALSLKANPVTVAFSWAEAGVFDEAARLLAGEAEKPSDSPMAWYYLALARLGQDKLAEYSKICVALLARPANKPGAVPPGQLIRLCILAPGAVPDMAPVVKMASAELKSSQSPSNRGVLGGAFFRAGQYEEAVRELTLAKKSHTQQTPLPPVYPFVLAMALHRTGKVEDARKELREAIEAFQAFQAIAKAPPGGWIGKLAIRLIRREAEDLILPPAKDKK